MYICVYMYACVYVHIYTCVWIYERLLVYIRMRYTYSGGNIWFSCGIIEPLIA